MNIDNIIEILQASIAPCVLISGLGLLLLSMTNRLARPIDRIRVLNKELRSDSGRGSPGSREQILILFKRCQLLQRAIAWTVVSIFLVSIIILALFFAFFFSINIEFLIKALFTGSLVSLITSLAFFLRDIHLTLNSLKIEIQDI